MNRKTTTTYQLERKLFYTSLSFIFILFVLYVYFVSAAVAHVVVRKEVAQEITRTQARVSELESEYITARDAVSLDAALSYGFLENDEKVFIEKAQGALVLSHNDTR